MLHAPIHRSASLLPASPFVNLRQHLEDVQHDLVLASAELARCRRLYTLSSRSTRDAVKRFYNALDAVWDAQQRAA